MCSSYYDENAEQFIKNTLHVDMREFYSAFTSYLNKSAHILDAGCGSGRDTLNFLSQGFLVDAIDSSIQMVKYATKLTGIEVRHCGFDEINALNKYDGIWCCASLLHIPKDHLIDTMQNLANALQEKGIWYISFKYGNSEREVNGRHFTDLNEVSLLELVSHLNGIKVESVWITEDKRVERSEKWLNALLRKNSKV